MTQSIETYHTPKIQQYNDSDIIHDVKISDSENLCALLNNTGENICIAVIDTGIDVNHESFNKKVLKSLNFAPDIKVCFEVLKLYKVHVFNKYIHILYSILKKKNLFNTYFKRYYNCLYFLIKSISTEDIHDFEFLQNNKFKISENLAKIKKLYFTELSNYFNKYKTEVSPYKVYDLFLQKFSYNNQNYYFEDNSSTGNTCIDIHGTHVASICAGKKCGGITGIAPDAFLYDLCVQSNAIEGGLFFVQDALRWIAVFGKQLNIDIVNMSLGGRLPWGETECIINNIMSQNIIVIAATGNNQDIENNVESQYIGYPAGYPNVIAIGSLGHDVDKICNYDIKSTFSECGENIDFCCPGHKIVAAKANTLNDTIAFSGTSMACPYACGIIALVLRYLKNNNIHNIDNRKMCFFLSKMAQRVHVLQDNELILQTSFNTKVGFGKLDIDLNLFDSKNKLQQCFDDIPLDWKIEHVRPLKL
jgi:subtilisin family serine protease